MSLTDTLSDFRPRDLLATPTGAFDPAQQPITLRRQLLASHLRLAALCALSLALAVIAVHMLHGPVQETDQRRVPMTKAAMTVQIGLHRASAALRGWVALKDPAFRQSREMAWDVEIAPALLVMVATTELYGSPDEIRRLGTLQDDLQRLRSLQDWVEDVAEKPGNEPARMVLTQELIPLSANIDDLLANLLDAREEASSPVRPLQEMRFSITRSDRALGRFVVDGKAAEEAAYRVELEVLDHLSSRIANNGERESGALQAALNEALDTYRDLAESIIASRRSPRSNVAWNTIQTRLKPLENQVTLQLEAIAVHEASMVTAVVSWISGWVSTFNFASAILLALVSGVALLLSAAAARQISTPIYQLSQGVKRLERGYFHNPLREDGVAEVRQLITSFNRMQHAIEASHAQLRYLAHNDELTGLPNRKRFNEQLAQLSHAAERTANFVGIIYIDLDHFKTVNDSLGHDAGDALLRKFSNRLQDSVRDGDLAARIGGDEFVVILGSLADADDAREIVDRIRRNTGVSFEYGGKRITPSSTMGVAIAEACSVDAEHLQKSADMALYRAKRRERGTVEYFLIPTTKTDSVPQVSAH